MAKLTCGRVRLWWRKEIRPVLILLLVLTSIRSSLADWSDVPTGSMKPTIVEGDRVLVNKLAYDFKVPFSTWHVAEWSGPQRGDIVVFFSPKDGTRMIKRVVGLPGDSVELRENRLIINNEVVEYEPLPEQRVLDMTVKDRGSHHFATEHLPGRSHAVASFPIVPAMRDFKPIRVPDGCYFMMGDNRDDSYDSRYFGAVEREKIVGRATSVVLSLDRENYWKPRWSRFFTALDPAVK